MNKALRYSYEWGRVFGGERNGLWRVSLIWGDGHTKGVVVTNVPAVYYEHSYQALGQAILMDAQLPTPGG